MLYYSVLDITYSNYKKIIWCISLILKGKILLDIFLSKKSLAD
jgi:hypothetical protein